MDLLTGEPCSLEDHRAWRSDIEFTLQQEEEDGEGEGGEGWLDVLPEDDDEGDGLQEEEEKFSQPQPSFSQMDRLQQEDDLQVGEQFSQPLPLSQVSANLFHWTACSRRTTCR